jgi:hypothetical protein
VLEFEINENEYYEKLSVGCPQNISKTTTDQTSLTRTTAQQPL